MIPTPNQVWLLVEPIDMRAGIDGLSRRIQNTLGWGCKPKPPKIPSRQI